jgi:hypothetical protein
VTEREREQEREKGKRRKRKGEGNSGEKELEPLTKRDGDEEGEKNTIGTIDKERKRKKEI